MFPDLRRQKKKNELRTCCGPTHIALNKLRRTVFIRKIYDLNMNLNSTNKKTEILQMKLMSLVTAQAMREQHVCLDNCLARK
jgi:hypothetical protein